MNTRKILIGSGVAAAVLTGAVFAWSTVWPTAPSYAAGVVARQARFAGHGHGRGHGRAMAMICTDRRDRHIEDGRHADQYPPVESIRHYSGNQTERHDGDAVHTSHRPQPELRTGQLQRQQPLGHDQDEGPGV